MLLFSKRSAAVIDGSENEMVGWILNFGVRMLLKGAETPSFLNNIPKISVFLAINIMVSGYILVYIFVFVFIFTALTFKWR